MRGPNKPKPLNPQELRTLFTVDKFRLLTFDQGVRLGLGNRNQVRDIFEKLVNLKLIGRTEQRDPDVLSKLPYLHFLKPAGARALEAAFGERGMPAKRRLRTQEVRHRRGIVDVHIALQAWLKTANGWQLEAFTTDFEPGSKGRHKATAFQKMRERDRAGYPPDATAHLRDGDGTLWGILVEYERGGANADLSPFKRKKLPLLRELAGGQPRNSADEPLEPYFVEEQFAEGMQKAVRFAIVFEDEDRRDRALKGWPEPTSPDWARFFIKALPELETDFNGGWWRPDGTQRPLFLLS